MTSFFTKEIFFTRIELPTALEGIDTEEIPHKSEVDNSSGILDSKCEKYTNRPCTHFIFVDMSCAEFDQI
jgi:hypothetical protein